jgi:hypothetical protein
MVEPERMEQMKGNLDNMYEEEAKNEQTPFFFSDDKSKAFCELPARFSDRAVHQ